MRRLARGPAHVRVCTYLCGHLLLDIVRVYVCVRARARARACVRAHGCSLCGCAWQLQSDDEWSTSDYYSGAELSAEDTSGGSKRRKKNRGESA
jgi:hypothetical protein